ncbi:MAG: imidazolonepropionase [Ignavibacteriales bacterium]|nr:MAG: imidazolonepropionase [Ignavibacteriales bacterium]
MLKLLVNPLQIVTVNTSGKNYLRGKEMEEIGVLENHSILIEDDIIKDFIPNNSINEINADQIIDIKDKTILPGLIDCHTHLVFAGSRAEEFKLKLEGIRYEEIAEKGGGINRTVKSVIDSGFEELVEISGSRIDYAISQGITTLEIKSGYGLSFQEEIKILEVINHLNKIYPVDIIPTFLGAHTYPLEFKNHHNAYIDIILNEMLPYVAKNKLAKFCDAFCESTAFSSPEVDMIFSKASELGFQTKLHTDQFNSIGGVKVGLKYNSTSLEHLEVIGDNDIKRITNSDCVAVLLPGVSFFLRYGYAPARKLIDNNSIVALSTDFNPGSSNIANLNLIMTLAALNMNMKIEETISAVTINAAKALDVNNSVGSIEIGKKADFAVIDSPEYYDIVYQVGKNLNLMTIKNGNIIYKKS